MKKIKFEFWFENYGKLLLKGLLVVVLVLLFLLAGFRGFQVIQKEKSDNNANYNLAQSDKYFAVLQEKTNVSPSGQNYVVADLFLKKPFCSESDINNALYQEVGLILSHYNGSHNNKLKAIGFRIYDRELVWRMGLTPRCIADYTVQPAIAQKYENKQQQKQQQQILGKKQAKQMQQQPIVNAVTPASQCWDYTLSNQNKAKNYQTYSVNLYGFQPYNKNKTVKPLSNQEFAIWLKLKMYQTAIGANSFDSAIQLYLNYDLNGQVNQEDFNAIAENFEKLNQREEAIGDNTNYYPNAKMLRQELAIYRPQLLCLILTGKTPHGYLQAQKKILASSNGADYKSIITKHLKQVGNNVDKYGNPDYVYKGDVFAGLTGTSAVKNYPKLYNYPFSPNLLENNKLYPLNSGASTSIATQTDNNNDDNNN